MEAQVKLAAKLYQCRDAAKGLYKDEYKQKIQWYTETIEFVQKAKLLDTLSAVLLICKDPIVLNNGMAMMLFMAAAVEIIEPTKTDN